MTIKTIDDYLEKVHEKYPDLDIDETKAVLIHGFRSLYSVQKEGGDVILASLKTKLYSIFGRRYADPKKQSHVFNTKWRIKSRLQYLLRTKKYNGYYYFGITEDDYKKYLSSGKKEITIENFKGYKVKEELYNSTNLQYFFKYKNSDESKFIMRKDIYTVSDPQLVAIRKGHSSKLTMINE